MLPETWATAAAAASPGNLIKIQIPALTSDFRVRIQNFWPWGLGICVEPKDPADSDPHSNLRGTVLVTVWKLKWLEGGGRTD